MNVNTGQVHESFEKAIAAGEDPQQLVTGPSEAIQKLSRLVVARNKRNARRKTKRDMQRASRKANR